MERDRQAGASPAAERARQQVGALFNPRNVVIAGASDRPGSWSRGVWDNLRRYGFAGPIFPMNPGRDTVWDTRCYRQFADLPETPDHVVVLVPARDVAATLEQAATAGARSATVFTAGFEEADDDAAQGLSTKLREVIARTGLAVSGPNCLGNLVAASRLMTMTDKRPHDMLPGPIAIIGQSGGVATAIKRTLNDRGLHVGTMVTIGNQAGLTAADYIDYFAADPQTRVIVCYLEAIRAPARFLDACRAARVAGKPVIVVKLGGSPEGRAAAQAHTGALAGAFEAFDAVAGAAGAIRVKTLDDAVELTEFFLHAPLPKGRGIGAITFSGGLRGLLMDGAAANGMVFPELAQETRQKLAEILGVGTIIGNPLDAGFAALSSQANYLAAIRILLDDPSIDVLLLQEEIVREAGLPKEQNLLKVDALAADGTLHKPVAFCSMISYHYTDYSRDLRGRLAHVPFLHEPDRALRALRGVFDYVGARNLAEGSNADRAAPAGGADAPLREKAERGGGALDEVASKTLLKGAGISVPGETLAASADAAVLAATKIGFPVVLKIVSADIAHKSDIGGVRLDLRDEAAVRAAYTDIMTKAAEAKPDARLDGVLVTPYVAGGLELVLGIQNDPDMGCVVMVGAGGVLLELLKDAAFGPPGLDARQAEAMIARTRVGTLIDGYRGAGPYDRAALVEALVALGQLAARHGGMIEAVDVNPFVLLPAGRGGVALDALVVARPHMSSK